MLAMVTSTGSLVGGAAGGAGGVAGAAGAGVSIAEPHNVQNFESAAFSLPHVWHLMTSTPVHRLRKSLDRASR